MLFSQIFSNCLWDTSYWLSVFLHWNVISLDTNYVIWHLTLHQYDICIIIFQSSLVGSNSNDLWVNTSKAFHASAFLSRKFVMHNAAHNLFREIRHFLTLIVSLTNHIGKPVKNIFFLAISKTWKCEMWNSYRSNTRSSFEEIRFPCLFWKKFKDFFSFPRKKFETAKLL